MIRVVDREEELGEIEHTDVQAAFMRRAIEGPAAAELSAAIEAEVFSLPRTITPWVSAHEMNSWLGRQIADQPISADARICLLELVGYTVELTGELSGASRFMIRIFTDRPNARCGFHLDTVPAGSPETGLLYVFNGTGTSYVESENVTSMPAFYAFLDKRDALVRRSERAGRRGADQAAAGFKAEVAQLDTALPFLADAHDIKVVPSGTVIVFKQLEARLHWSDHSPGLVWIHSSPSSGRPRLVINIAGKERARPKLKGVRFVQYAR